VGWFLIISLMRSRREKGRGMVHFQNLIKIKMGSSLLKILNI